MPRDLRFPRRAAALLALAVLAPAGAACESCRRAVANDTASLADGLNASILFMLLTVAAVLGGFLLLVWGSYRLEARRAARGEGFEAEGKLRWSAVAERGKS